MNRAPLENAIDALIERHGSYRAAARVLRIDHVYLWRIRKGLKDNPSAKLLKKLHLKREVTIRYSEQGGQTDGR